jgi:capsular polysaccharide biosynthesis protein
MPASRSQRLREEKFNQNIKKRGNVSIGKAAEHIDDTKPRVSNTLIAFFIVVVVGSSFVQVLRMFQTSVPNLS